MADLSGMVVGACLLVSVPGGDDDRSHVYFAVMLWIMWRLMGHARRKSKYLVFAGPK